MEIIFNKSWWCKWVLRGKQFVMHAGIFFKFSREIFGGFFLVMTEAMFEEV